MPGTTATFDRHAAAIAATAHRPRREVARELGLHPGTVGEYRTRLRAAGALPPATPRRKFAPEAEATALRMLAAGVPAAQVAREYGVSETRIRQIPGYRPAVEGRIAERLYTLDDVAGVFGVSKKAARAWLTRGYLAAGRLGEPPKAPRRGRRLRDRRPYLISMPDLVAFVQDRRAWMSYDPARISEPDLRRVAERYRAEAPGEWLDARALARLAHYSATAVRRWLRAGWLVGWDVVTWGQGGRGGVRHWWVPRGRALPEPPAEGWRG